MNVPFLLVDQLTEDQRLIAETAHACAQEKRQPRIVNASLEEKADRAIFAEMGELGPLGVTVSDGCGGAGANYVSYGPDGTRRAIALVAADRKSPADHASPAPAPRLFNATKRQVLTAHQNL